MRRKRGVWWLFGSWILYWLCLFIVAFIRPLTHMLLTMVRHQNGTASFTISVSDSLALFWIFVPPLLLFGFWLYLNRSEPQGRPR